MARKKKTKKKIAVETYKHDSAKRKNIPTAKMAGEGKIPKVAKATYSYSPHLSPVLRFDASGRTDRLTEIVEKVAEGKKLSIEEAEILRGVAANASQPWLEWSGKTEEHDRQVFEVEPVALHIHERVSANAIIRAAKREDVQADMFADPQLEYKEAIQFYKHDVDWANRLILGDSLEVMSSLARREDLAGKVKMIYVDPPYGISYQSNFTPSIGQVDVKTKDSDLSREAETVRAYSDTWHLGQHSYLSYLRDRFLLVKELLSEDGSVFVQISDDRLHVVRSVMDAVFGAENFVNSIAYVKTTSSTSNELSSVYDSILWYRRSPKMKYRQLYSVKKPGQAGATGYRTWLLPTGELVPDGQLDVSTVDPKELDLIFSDNVTSQSPGSRYDINLSGKTYRPEPGYWKTDPIGMERLLRSNRILAGGKYPGYMRKISDFPTYPLSNVWSDTLGQNQFGGPKIYPVQTALKVVTRCMLMCTDPGDLVLDPTCGSGTTAIVAEEWGRRWITIDTSRVAVSLARQRILTSKFDLYRIRNFRSSGGKALGMDPSANFIYKTIPHITLGSIAQNKELDPIFEKHEPVLETALEKCNLALGAVTDDLRSALVNKLAEKLQSLGLRAATVADHRRWLLPGTSKAQIQSAFQGKSRLKPKHVTACVARVPINGNYDHWNVPFDTDDDWPKDLIKACSRYREAWGEKIDEIDACISSNADQEVLVDQPEKIDNVVRVSGPFSVEGVRPEELSLDESGNLFDPTPNEWDVHEGAGDYAQNVSAYIDRMVKLLKVDGVTFPNNEHRTFTHIELLERMDSAIHAEAIWSDDNVEELCNIAIAFGPQFGPVTAEQIEDLIRASRRYDELVIAGFSFDGAAQSVIQESENPRLKIHMAHIRPDASPGMDGLLKESPKSQLFTVFGQPEIEVRLPAGSEGGEFEVELVGVDIYSPVTGEIRSSGANKVAAWFLDSDYDGRCFCVTQAFFPNQKAWDKIAKALGSAADIEAFAAYNGTVSVPFEPGEHKRIAVKVIDPRGNEVMAIRSLEGSS